jgi:hypothetical protein
MCLANLCPHGLSGPAFQLADRPFDTGLDDE